MLIVANWKMNCSKAEANALLSAIKAGYSGKNEVVLCPAFTLLSTVSELVKNTKIQLGAQDCSTDDNGAHTGDVSAQMLSDIPVKYVIIGHSERRKQHNESDELTRRKALEVTKYGLIPIICIGETLEEKNAGKTENIIKYQMENSIPKDIAGKYIIAYEPVWAIGTGVTPTNDEITKAHAFISSKQRGIKILYGGSVNDKNCLEICTIKNVSGLLVGGASIDSTKFTKIMNL